MNLHSILCALGFHDYGKWYLVILRETAHLRLEVERRYCVHCAATQERMPGGLT
jgi:hypothetical protein